MKHRHFTLFKHVRCIIELVEFAEPGVKMKGAEGEQCDLDELRLGRRAFIVAARLIALPTRFLNSVFAANLSFC